MTHHLHSQLSLKRFNRSVELTPNAKHEQIVRLASTIRESYEDGQLSKFAFAVFADTVSMTKNLQKVKIQNSKKILARF